MYPVDRCMDSYPYQTNKMHYAPHYRPSFDDVSQQVNVPANSRATCESWPYGGFPYPVECHGCFNHNYFPGYYGFRPPYPYFPLQSSFQCYGSYPAFPGTYPTHYFPPQCARVQPRYEYAKDMPRDHHCCGCPNHQCNQKGDKNLRIEEQEPDAEKKSNDSLVPSELKNYLYPVMCFHLQGGDERRSKCQQNEENSPFPFPIYWMPYKPEEVKRKDLKETKGGQQSVEELPSNVKITPVRFPDIRGQPDSND
ncbi:unnamed protein product [Ilex paraguariensis]|uniref:Uncharacterized protein n=1 Tax=Ilex paraguariensis TaxID=185542 RepID=A0ABC8S9L2_9AQUA